MRVGISGHQRLGDASRQLLVQTALHNMIATFQMPLIAVTSLAAGSDQLFTNVMLSYGASVEAIIPFDGYERTFGNTNTRNEYFALLRRATHVTILPRSGNDEECFLQAGKMVVSKSDILIAIWNGKPARGLGGTADIVRFARDEKRVEIRWINPEANAVVETIPSRAFS